MTTSPRKLNRAQKTRRSDTEVILIQNVIIVQGVAGFRSKCIIKDLHLSFNPLLYKSFSLNYALRTSFFLSTDSSSSLVVLSVPLSAALLDLRLSRRNKKNGKENTLRARKVGGNGGKKEKENGE